MTVILRAQAGLDVVDDEIALLADHRQVSRQNTAERRRLLGEFIRSRRERTTPDMVGMPPGLRRRTPGLRREEVALLSGIGITWYTWLEQGRPINVSGQVLQSVARVLHLDASERAHIFALAELPDPAQSTEVAQVGAGVQLLLDQLNPLPAVVLGPRLEILAGNRAHLGLLGDYHAAADRLPQHHVAVLHRSALAHLGCQLGRERPPHDRKVAHLDGRARGGSWLGHVVGTPRANLTGVQADVGAARGRTDRQLHQAVPTRTGRHARCRSKPLLALGPTRSAHDGVHAAERRHARTP